MALPTMRKIVGDDTAFMYFEEVLGDLRKSHPYMNRSISESTAAFGKLIRGGSNREIREDDTSERATSEVGTDTKQAPI